MSTYFKYAERTADSQVNYAEIGKNVSQMLSDEVKVREEKKKAIDDATREYGNVLANSPQGQFQDANKFITDYVSGAQQMRLNDDKLLKAGQMDLKTYTFRRQNLQDGTTTMFNLQKKFQDAYQKRMDGIKSGELQAFNAFNMSEVEGFGDFSKSKAIIDPTTMNVNVGKMKYNDKTKVFELSNEVVPANVLMGKINTEIPTFKVEESMNAAVKTMGKRFESLYQAATTSGAGTITELTGPDAIKKYGKWGEAVSDFNKALTSLTDSYFANPYNLMSVLTENTGKYSAESYTYDKNLAAKDPSKILLKQNTSTGMGEIDKSAPNYATQKKEADEWVKSQIKLKLDAEKAIKTTAQAQTQYAPEYVYDRADKKKETNAAINAWGNVFKAETVEDKRQAVETLLGTKYNQDRGLMDLDFNTPGKVIFKYSKDSKIPDRILDFDPKTATLRQWAELGNEVTGVDDISQVMKQIGGGDPNRKMSEGQRKFIETDATGNIIKTASAGRVKQTDPNVAFSETVRTANPRILDKGKTDAAKDLSDFVKQSGITGVTFTPSGPLNPFSSVTAKVKDAAGKEQKFEIETNNGTDSPDSDTQMNNFIQWLEQNVTPAQKIAMLKAGGLRTGAAPSGTTPTSRTPAPR